MSACPKTGSACRRYCSIGECAEGNEAAGMDFDRIHKAWYAVGADLAGLEWNKFVQALAASPASVPAQQPTAAGDAAPVSEKERRDARMLTRAEIYEAWRDSGPYPASYYAVIRKFCEVNGIALTREAGEQEGASK